MHVGAGGFLAWTPTVVGCYISAFDVANILVFHRTNGVRAWRRPRTGTRTIWGVTPAALAEFMGRTTFSLATN
jgi:hypothetical protein